MQQTSQPPYMRHKPFRILLVLTIIASFLFGVFIVLATSCQENCILQQDDRYFNCYIDDMHYCCSAYSNYGPASCGDFTDCVESDGLCDGYDIGMYVSGALGIILMMAMVVVAYQFTKQHNAMMENAYQNMENNQVYNQGYNQGQNQGYNQGQNQGYSMHQQPPVIYPNLPFNQPNNQLIVNGQNYNKPRNQLN